MLDESATMIEYRRLRAPDEDRESLVEPAFEDASDLVFENQASAAKQSPEIAGQSLANLSELGRTELLDLAFRYTSSYRNTALDQRNANTIIMSGHQPKLFRPGVWFKNFALSNLGKRLGATPVNLIVDNDIAGVTSVSAPDLKGSTATINHIPVDQPGANIPFECRSIVDPYYFRQFSRRVTDAMLGMVVTPLVARLWPHACSQLTADSNYGAVLAKGRHLLEQDAGLETLEVPLSQVAETKAFSYLALEIFQRIQDFHTAYNTCLYDYRDIHRIRSNSHPVPALEKENGFYEAPFWVWHTQHPIRKPLFIKRDCNGHRLTDRSGWQVTIEIDNFAAQFCELRDQGVAIRPRALVTTLFSRMILSDLFLHGIGGSKYDQLTDAIAQRFLNFEMPKYLTLTATATLPCETENVLPSDVTDLDTLDRDLRFHPENHVAGDAPQIAKWVARKHYWLNQALPPGKRKDRHQGINQCNEQLQAFVHPSRQRLAQEREQLTSRLKINQIARSREYSYSLFPENLIEDLKTLAQ